MLAVALACAVISIGTVSAHAATQWRVVSTHGPTNLPPNGTGEYVLQVYNIGDADGNTDPVGDPLTLVDTLPAGVTATGFSGSGWSCSVPATTVTCTSSDTVQAPTVGVAPPDFRGAAAVLYLNVSIDPGATGEADNTVAVSGGGAPDPASGSDPTVFDATPAGFGLVSDTFGADAFDAAIPNGAPVRQAGAHPFEARFDLDFNLQQTVDPTFGTFTEPVEHVKTIEVELPAGFVGNPEATPKCTNEQLVTAAPQYQTQGSCPPGSQVGTVDLSTQNVDTIFPFDKPNITQDVAIYNMVPPKGTVADFAFQLNGFPVHLIASLDPANHYAVKTTVAASLELLPIRSAHLALWGVPADPAHDPLRFLATPLGGGSSFYGTPAGVAPPKPFITLPSQCDTAGAAQVTIDSWQHPGATKSSTSTPVTLDGCARQQFDASISAQPSTTKPDSPSGLTFDLAIPQNETAAGLGTPALKKAVVRFPAGMSVAPSSANGLLGCSSAQIALGTNEDPACPDASKIGSAELTTPLLPNPVAGSVYLAAQNDNPFGSLIALYIVIDDPDRGLLIKLPGEIATDPVTGQVSATFDDNPQLPFSNLHVRLKSGSRAPLTTPLTCGPQTTTAELTSWNSSLPVVTATDTFTISADGNGAPCAAPGFHPGLKAGTANPIAGKDSTLITTITRSDGDQQLGTVDVTMPQGLLGRVASVVLCPSTAANAGTCQDVSKIGIATVAAGAGATPFYITDGKVFITGPYKGAPFGLSIVVHAQAGPFDLGNVIVRAAIFVDRSTAALRIVTDPLPTILDGIPLRLRIANVRVDRPGFTFNPTSCSPKQATGKITSDIGTVANLTSRFQVADCGALPFHPRMSLSVGSKHHTAANVTTPLSTTITMSKGQANLKTVSVTLPLTINARLPVVNQACTLAAFEAGHCTTKAKVGTAVAVTPLLRDPLRGSVFFVKNPKRVIPDLMIALRGQVNFDLTGKVSIPGGKFLSTRFDTVPDVPITRFTLRLVSGRNGPIGTTTNLCGAKAKAAPVKLGLRAQNGRLVRVSQRLHISGCPRAAKSNR